jgi:hypothetical protein
MKTPGSCNSFQEKALLASHSGYPLYCFWNGVSVGRAFRVRDMWFNVRRTRPFQLQQNE